MSNECVDMQSDTVYAVSTGEEKSILIQFSMYITFDTLGVRRSLLMHAVSTVYFQTDNLMMRFRLRPKCLPISSNYSGSSHDNVALTKSIYF